MNQILSVEGNNRKRNNYNNTQPIEIKKIVKFFAIVLFVFGICLIGTGSYGMYKDNKGIVSTAKPTIYVEGTGEGEITLKITYNKELSRVTYSWSGKEVKEITCLGKKSVEEKIEIPSGTNTLTVYASAVNGQEMSYQKTYTQEGDIVIDSFEASSKGVKVKATGVNELSYMTYRWDDEEEERIDINDTKFEQIIETPIGNHTLTVVIVDINNTTETREEKIVGTRKPKLDVVADSDYNFVITCSDEQGLEKVEFIINEEKKFRIMLDGKTEFEYAYPLDDGENKLEVTAYNINNVSEKVKVKLIK